jgi:hypothetical protein
LLIGGWRLNFFASFAAFPSRSLRFKAFDFQGKALNREGRKGTAAKFAKKFKFRVPDG